MRLGDGNEMTQSQQPNDHSVKEMSKAGGEGSRAPFLSNTALIPHPHISLRILRFQGIKGVFWVGIKGIEV